MQKLINKIDGHGYGCACAALTLSINRMRALRSDFMNEAPMTKMLTVTAAKAKATMMTTNVIYRLTFG